MILNNKLKLKTLNIHTSSKDIQIPLSDKVIYFGKNSSGKSVLANSLVRPFGHKINLSGNIFQNKSTCITIVFEYNKKSTTLKIWPGKTHLNKELNGEIINNKGLCDYLLSIEMPIFPEFYKNIGVGLWSQTFAPQSARFKELVADETYSSGDELKYSYWMQSLVDYFSLQKTLLEITKISNKIKEEKKLLERIQEKLDAIEEVSFDNVHIKEQYLVETLKDDYYKLEKYNEALTTLLDRLELERILNRSDNLDKILKEKFDNVFIEYKGIKITINNFLENAELEKKDEEISKISSKINLLNEKIGNITNLIASKRTELMALTHNKSILFNNDYDSLTSEINIYTRDIANYNSILKNLKESKKESMILNEKQLQDFRAHAESKFSNLSAEKKSGPFKAIKISRNSDRGWEAVQLWIEMLLYAAKKRGLVMPVIIDSLDEFVDKDNFQEYTKKIAELNSQIIITTHNETIYNKFQNLGFEAREIPEELNDLL